MVVMALGELLDRKWRHDRMASVRLEIDRFTRSSHPPPGARTLGERVQLEVERSRRAQEPLSCVRIHIDRIDAVTHERTRKFTAECFTFKHTLLSTTRRQNRL